MSARGASGSTGGARGDLVSPTPVLGGTCQPYRRSRKQTEKGYPQKPRTSLGECTVQQELEF